MSLKMKNLKFLRIVALALAVATLFTVTVFAAGTDDGKISVVAKDSVKYFGTEKSEWCVSYTAADGSGKEFCRYSAVSLNGDTVTDITDLVYLHNIIDTGTCDINGDGKTDFGDTEVLRMLLLGENDF